MKTFNQFLTEQDSSEDEWDTWNQDIYDQLKDLQYELEQEMDKLKNTVAFGDCHDPDRSIKVLYKTIPDICNKMKAVCKKLKK